MFQSIAFRRKWRPDTIVPAPMKAPMKIKKPIKAMKAPMKAKKIMKVMKKKKAMKTMKAMKGSKALKAMNKTKTVCNAEQLATSTCKAAQHATTGPASIVRIPPQKDMKAMKALNAMKAMKAMKASKAIKAMKPSKVMNAINKRKTICNAEQFASSTCNAEQHATTTEAGQEKAGAHEKGHKCERCLRICWYPEGSPYTCCCKTCFITGGKQHDEECMPEIFEGAKPSPASIVGVAMATIEPAQIVTPENKAMKAISKAEKKAKKKKKKKENPQRWTTEELEYCTQASIEVHGGLKLGRGPRAQEQEILTLMECVNQMKPHCCEAVKRVLAQDWPHAFRFALIELLMDPAVLHAAHERYQLWSNIFHGSTVSEAEDNVCPRWARDPDPEESSLDSSDV